MVSRRRRVRDEEELEDEDEEEEEDTDEDEDDDDDEDDAEDRLAWLEKQVGEMHSAIMGAQKRASKKSSGKPKKTQRMRVQGNERNRSEKQPKKRQESRPNTKNLRNLFRRKSG